MKRELREEIARDQEWREPSGLSKFVENNLSLLKAFGLAAAVVVTGLGAVQLVKISQEKKGKTFKNNFLI